MAQVNLFRTKQYKVSGLFERKQKQKEGKNNLLPLFICTDLKMNNRHSMFQPQRNHFPFQTATNIVTVTDLYDKHFMCLLQLLGFHVAQERTTTKTELYSLAESTQLFIQFTSSKLNNVVNLEISELKLYQVHNKLLLISHRIEII